MRLGKNYIRGAAASASRDTRAAIAIVCRRLGIRAASIMRTVRLIFGGCVTITFPFGTCWACCFRMAT
jgi:hypothetical protein